MTEQDLKKIKNQNITAADMPISMNRASERLNAKMIEWEEHPEHFDGLNPFAIAAFEIRQKTLKWEAQEPCEDAVSREAALEAVEDLRLNDASDELIWLSHVRKQLKALPSVQFSPVARVMTLIDK